MFSPILTLIIFFLTLFKNFTLIYKKDISLNFLKSFEKFKSFNLIIILSSCVYVCIFGLVIPNLSKLYPSQSIYSKLKTIKYIFLIYIYKVIKGLCPIAIAVTNIPKIRNGCALAWYLTSKLNGSRNSHMS